MPELPERLRRNGRVADQEFTQAEKLFRRYLKNHLVNGQFSGIGLSFDDPPSLNREKYSECRDVLISPEIDFAAQGYGVLSLRVHDATMALPADQPMYSFQPRHVPIDENFAHSEIWCDRVEPTGNHVIPNKGTRKLARTVLGQKAIVEIEANA